MVSAATRSDVRKLWRDSLPVSRLPGWIPARPEAMYSLWLRGVLVYIGITGDVPRRLKEHRKAKGRARKNFDTARWQAIHGAACEAVEAAFIAFFLPGQNGPPTNFEPTTAEVILRDFGYSVSREALVARTRPDDGRRLPLTVRGLRVLWHWLADEEREVVVRIARRGPTRRQDLNIGPTQLMRIARNANVKCRAASPVLIRGINKERTVEVVAHLREAVLQLGKDSGY